jgi:hypothetical protein
MSGHGDEIAISASFDPQNAEAVLGIVERHLLDDARQDFGLGIRTLLNYHRRPILSIDRMVRLRWLFRATPSMERM